MGTRLTIPRSLYSRHCATCGDIIYDPTKAVEAEVVLNSAVMHYLYCSDKCLNKKLDNLNSTNGKFDLEIEVVRKDVVSLSPKRYRIVCRIKNLHVEAL